MTPQLDSQAASQMKLVKNLIPEAILGSTKFTGKMEFWIRFKGNSEPRFVLSSVTNLCWPQDVINFYESHLKWF